MWEGLAEGRTVWLLLATATQLAVLTCQARVDCAIEAGVDFPGNDYATVRPGQRGHDGLASSCAALCFRQALCRAWTLRVPSAAGDTQDDVGNCYLKTDRASPEPANDAVSGLPCLGDIGAFRTRALAAGSSQGSCSTPIVAPSTGGPASCWQWSDSRLVWGDVGFVDTVWIVSTGSTSRPGLQEIQNLTIGRHFRLITFTEANVDACVLCAPGAATDAPPDPNMKKREGGARGWWCAQKRILPALAAVLRSQPALEFPAFLMLIDDDTAVNPQALLRHTAALDPGVPLYTGQLGATRDHDTIVGRKMPFINGGGGALLSRAVLLLLNGAGIEDCVRRIQGGSWCDWHSDWTLAACIARVAGTVSTDANPGLFNQLGGREACTRASITCHEKMTAADMLAVYHMHQGS